MADLTPEQVASREFKTTFRGYEPDEVRAFLATIAAGLGRLLEEHAALTATAATGADLEAEIDTVTSEIGLVLQTAREAAEAMRERAGAESARWRSESVADAQAIRSSAEEDAVALRADAWTTAEQLLQQTHAEAVRIREHADADALQIIGEAERDAHRLAANTRREADDVLRAARMEAEQLVIRAKAEHDEIINNAIRQSEAAQERTRALESRRHELMRELDLVRSTLNEVEGEVDQRREKLGLSETVNVVTPAAPPEPAPTAEKPPAGPEPGSDGEIPENWVPGETVRVVRRSRPSEAGEVVRPDLAPDVKVVSAAEMARRNDPDAADLEAQDETPPEEPVPALDDDDHPMGTMVRPAEPEVAIPASRAAGPSPASVPSISETDATADDDDAEPDADTTGDPGAPTRPEAPIPAAVPPDGGELPVEELDDDASESVGEPGHESPEGLRPAPGQPADAPAASVGPDPVEHAENGDASHPRGVRAQSSPRIVAAGDIPRRHAALMTDEPTAGEDEGEESFEDLDGLFQRLRTDDDEPVTSIVAGSTEQPAPAARSVRRAGPDPFELRDRLLLPVGNRALRSLKRQLTEEQNLVLEEIRLGEGSWAPNVSSIHDRVRADLVVLHAESFGAGHAGGLELLGERAPRPATPQVDLAEPFAEALAAELDQTVTEGRHLGQGARQLGASLSRVFRAWRTDQAERRVREIALASYHDGLARTTQLAGVDELQWVVGGRRCATCRARAEEPVSDHPPAHAGCECTIAP